MPPHLLQHLLKSDHDGVRDAALNTLLGTERLRGQRSSRGASGGVPTVPADGRRTMFDCNNGVRLTSAKRVRGEDDAAAADDTVNRAFDALGTTRDFFRTVFRRNSIDGRGMPLNGYVHRGKKYNDAFWDGQGMVFGDGDGVVFKDFSASLEVIAHELTHGITEHTAGLEYHNQSGSLNESVSDVFGSLVKQWSRGETADKADWLIGADILTPDFPGDAVRSLKEPGTAYFNPMMGRDHQPAHMKDFVHQDDDEKGDFGGVHLNSGIPNKAFYLAAINIGGNAWEAPGLIWYESLKASGPRTDFQEFADTSFVKAGLLYGSNSHEQQAVASGWEGVGIHISTPSEARARALGQAPAQNQTGGPAPSTPQNQHTPGQVGLPSAGADASTASGRTADVAPAGVVSDKGADRPSERPAQ